MLNRFKAIGQNRFKRNSTAQDTHANATTLPRSHRASVAERARTATGNPLNSKMRHPRQHTPCASDLRPLLMDGSNTGSLHPRDAAGHTRPAINSEISTLDAGREQTGRALQTLHHDLKLSSLLIRQRLDILSAAQTHLYSLELREQDQIHQRTLRVAQNKAQAEIKQLSCLAGLIAQTLTSRKKLAFPSTLTVSNYQENEKLLGEMKEIGGKSLIDYEATLHSARSRLLRRNEEIARGLSNNIRHKFDIASRAFENLIQRQCTDTVAERDDTLLAMAVKSRITQLAQSLDAVNALQETLPASTRNKQLAVRISNQQRNYSAI